MAEPLEVTVLSAGRNAGRGCVPGWLLQGSAPVKRVASLLKCKRHRAFDPAIWPLGLTSQSQSHPVQCVCTGIFIAALFVVAQNPEQRECLPLGRAWIECGTAMPWISVRLDLEGFPREKRRQRTMGGC